MEFSKKFAVWIFIVFGIFAFACLYLKAYKGIAVEGILGILCPIPVAIVGFYYNKSKEENLVKISNSTTTTASSDVNKSI